MAELPPHSTLNAPQSQGFPVGGASAGSLNEAIAQLAGGLSHAQPKRAKVAVLGGGISGLTSAFELAKQGVEVTVIEGSSRLGGHISTKRDAIGDLYFERGAELVDSNQLALQKLMGELGVGLVDSSQTTDGDFFHAGGKVHSDEQMLTAYTPLANELKKMQSQLRGPDGQWTDYARELDKVSMETMLDYYVQKGVVEEWVPEMFKKSYSGEIGRDPSKISAVAFLDSVGADVERGLEMYGDSDEAYRVANGTESIIHALEDKLRGMGVNFRMNEQITELEKTGDNGMTVHSIKGEAIDQQRYDHVVSGLPLPALRQIKGIDAIGLSEDQLDIINETQYCTLTKFAVETKGKPWTDLRAEDGSGGNGTVYTDGTFQTAWVSSEGQPNNDVMDMNANGMITFFVGGTNAQMPTQELVAKAKQEYADILGKPVDEVFTDRPAAVANWATESRGCYVAPAMGQYTKLDSLREQTNPNFSLVGEYIPYPTERGASIGFMNNAADSAQRESARAVELLQSRGFDIAPVQQANRPAPQNPDGFEQQAHAQRILSERQTGAGTENQLG